MTFLKVESTRFQNDLNLLNFNLYLDIIGIYIVYISRVFCPRAGLSQQIEAPRLQFCPKADSGTKVAVLLGMNRSGIVLLLSASHSLFSISTDLKRSEKMPGAPSWK